MKLTRSAFTYKLIPFASSYVSALYGGYWSYAGWQGIPAVCEDIKDVKLVVNIGA